MKTTNRILAATSALLLLGAAVVPATALEIGLGGGGISLGGPGGPQVTATTVGGTNILSVGANSGQGTGAVVAVTNNDGSLIDLGQTDDITTASVNLGGGLNGLGGLGLGGVDPGGLGGLDLGGLDLGGLDIGGLNLGDTIGGLIPGSGAGGAGGVGGVGGAGGAGGGGAAVRVNTAFSGLSGGEQQQLRLRCRSIMSNPAAFDPSFVTLCRLIARAAQP